MFPSANNANGACPLIASRGVSPLNNKRPSDWPTLGISGSFFALNVPWSQLWIMLSNPSLPFFHCFEVSPQMLIYKVATESCFLANYVYLLCLQLSSHSSSKPLPAVASPLNGFRVGWGFVSPRSFCLLILFCFHHQRSKGGITSAIIDNSHWGKLVCRHTASQVSSSYNTPIFQWPFLTGVFFTGTTPSVTWCCAVSMCLFIRQWDFNGSHLLFNGSQLLFHLWCKL